MADVGHVTTIKIRINSRFTVGLVNSIPNNFQEIDGHKSATPSDKIQVIVFGEGNQDGRYDSQGL